jgi:hypothetical protein
MEFIVVKNYYVDSAKLERDWFCWMVSKAVPSLEPYRTRGLLWTRIIEVVREDDGSVFKKSGRDFLDPRHPIRDHCIYVGGTTGVYLQSKSGEIIPPIMKTTNGSKRAMPLERPFSEQIRLYGLPNNGFHPGDDYYLETATDTPWHMMCNQIGDMCKGIAMKFHLKSEEDRHDLAQEAFAQVANKLIRGKLVYIPGKAPVFNLLTTTIHRCMFSILSRATKQRTNTIKLAEGLMTGAIPPMTRSLRLYANDGNQAIDPIRTRQF